jgi:hypothetical protein
MTAFAKSWRREQPMVALGGTPDIGQQPAPMASEAIDPKPTLASVERGAMASEITLAWATAWEADALDVPHIEPALDSRRRCGTSAPSSIIRTSSQDALYGSPG